jgi:aspartyl protease family protein
MNFDSLNKSDWQNFIYLALILVMFFSSLLSRRDLSLSKIFKYLAIWSATGLTAVSVYAYRYEFQDFKNRILGEIRPSSLQIRKSGEMMVNLAQDGHFYIDAKVNGVASRFMIDTGASDIVINLEAAQKLGIDPKKLTFNKPYQTANGTSWGASVTLEEFQIGNVKFRNIPASVNNADMGTSLLGMSFLRQFRKYEFYRDKLILTL